MTPSPASRAAAALTAAREPIARATTEALYRESPALLARHGEPGREKCLQDMRYNLDHLVPAVELEDAPMFARYVGWLTELLLAHGVETRHVTRSLELLGDAAADHLAPDEAACVRRILAAALASAA